MKLASAYFFIIARHLPFLVGLMQTVYRCNFAFGAMNLNLQLCKSIPYAYRQSSIPLWKYSEGIDSVAVGFSRFWLLPFPLELQ